MIFLSKKAQFKKPVNLSMIQLSSFSLDWPILSPINVEISILPGLPSFTLVGWADSAWKECRDRIRSALKHLWVSLPAKRITINLSPAQIQKRGTHYDLPIAIGILSHIYDIPQKIFENTIFLWELSLDWWIRITQEILPILLSTKIEKKWILPSGIHTKFVPNQTFQCDHLRQILDWTEWKRVLEPYKTQEVKYNPPSWEWFSSLISAWEQKKSILYAAIGRHHCLLEWPPGVWKSHLVRAHQEILPDLNEEEQKNCLFLSSLWDWEKEILRPPLKNPHQSTSKIAILGGWRRCYPGDITLANNWVLWLDEIREFPREVLESLREPLENRNIEIERMGKNILYPASFQLMATSNPCPCGYLGDPLRPCRDTETQIQRYKNKISWPLQDRLDMYIWIGRLGKESDFDIDFLSARRYVFLAREVQKKRNPGGKLNSQLNYEEILNLWILPQEFFEIITKLAKKNGISFRWQLKILRLCMSIYDFRIQDFLSKNKVFTEKEESLLKSNILYEALLYRFPNERA
jgi:magnesium chelatase family protein